ncbi:MAG: hypothetical protein MMC23_008271, partial [Stictis urceolatum]|nr:hypothetical protein [Stictis urceolata]
MRLPATISALLLTCASPLAAAASSWGFADATISIQSKGAGVGTGLKENLSESKALPKRVELGPADTLKIILTTQEGKSAKRPHQAFLSVEDLSTGLETSFPLSVKESGKAKLELAQKDIPTQLLTTSDLLSASLIIASFGTSSPYSSKAFDLAIQTDPNVPAPKSEKPLRYGKLSEIHHIFRADPKSPPKIISLVFTVLVLGALPVLLGTWLMLGANANHLSKALGNAPVSHGLFIGAIVAMEGIFFMYYTAWNLFTTLPVAATAGTVIFLSGSRALT